MVVGFGWDYEVLAGVNLVVKNPKKKEGTPKKMHMQVPQERGLFVNLCLLGCSVWLLFVNAICMITILAHTHL